jgi:hypothetical protein
MIANVRAEAASSIGLSTLQTPRDDVQRYAFDRCDSTRDRRAEMRRAYPRQPARQNPRARRLARAKESACIAKIEVIFCSFSRRYLHANHAWAAGRSGTSTAIHRPLKPFGFAPFMPMWKTFATAAIT